MSNDYCFRRAAQGQLSQCNRRNITNVLRAVVKFQNGHKGTEVFACDVLEEVSETSQNSHGRSRAGVLLF